ncbi:MAG: class I SAM-dependent RNA methyltransferase [Bacteriovoracia bacterium]
MSTNGRSAETAEILNIRIDDLSRAGSGVGRDSQGRVIFVPRTAPGDLVRVAVTPIKKNYAEGELLEVVEPSSHRIAPKCAVFGRCGGCEWQHLPYALQWETKLKGVSHALARAGVDAGGVAIEALPAEKIWNYRNRVQLRGDGQALGFYAAGSHGIVSLKETGDRCEIAREEINGRIPEIGREKAGVSRPYKVELEVAVDGDLRATWNASHSFGGFRQIHDEQNLKLQAWVRAQVRPGGEVWDLYGGAGNLSLGLADIATGIDCVDTGSPVTPPPGTPAHFRFHRSSVLTWVLRQKAKGRVGETTGAPHVTAIFDPPRAGLGADFSDMERVLAALGVHEALLIGCDVDAWTRDLSRFVKRGWKIEALAALDLFPQTHHVEALARIRL